MKIKVSKYRLRWNTENVTSSIMSPQKKIHNYRFLRALYDWKSTSLLSGDDSLNYMHHTIIIETTVLILTVIFMFSDDTDFYNN